MSHHTFWALYALDAAVSFWLVTGMYRGHIEGWWCWPFWRDL